jgi:hypothetical protein
MFVDVNQMVDLELELLKRAMRGDRLATKLYCGSYDLVRDPRTKKLFKTKSDMQPGFIPVRELNRQPVYDSDGFLLQKYWGLPRLW